MATRILKKYMNDYIPKKEREKNSSMINAIFLKIQPYLTRNPSAANTLMRYLYGCILLI